jgi:electron transport complex protein RnfD
MDNSIVISTPPHVKSKRTTKNIMLDVIIALAPAAIAGIVFFGVNAFILELVSVLAAVATEFVYFFIANGGFSQKCKNAKTVCLKWWHQFDYTSIVTGLILALIVPTTVTWYQILLGSVFAIAIVKMLFGGTGKNLVNPAATGRVFMAISFSFLGYASCKISSIVAVNDIDAIVDVGATVLSGYKNGDGTIIYGLLQGQGSYMSLLDLFLGTGVAGTIGETCKLALIIGYIYLVVRKVIKWWQPVLYVVLSSFLSVCLAACTEGATFDISLFPYFAFSGGLMFGAIFMATDYVTSPKGIYGQIVYYVCLAVLTSVLRYYTKVEVVSYVIMLMNLIVPLIDTYIVRKPFGYKREKKQKEAK